jgi:hypothetical protein
VTAPKSNPEFALSASSGRSGHRRRRYLCRGTSSGFKTLRTNATRFDERNINVISGDLRLLRADARRYCCQSGTKPRLINVPRNDGSSSEGQVLLARSGVFGDEQIMNVEA